MKKIIFKFNLRCGLAIVSLCHQARAEWVLNFLHELLFL